MTNPDDEIIASLRSSPGDPPTPDVYARVVAGVRRRRHKHATFTAAGVAACVVAVALVVAVPAMSHGRSTDRIPPGGGIGSPQSQSVAVHPTCASTLDAQPSGGPAPSGGGLVPGVPSSAVLCEYDQIDQPRPLTRHAQLGAGQLAKTLAIIRELKLTDEVASCPLQPTVDLMTFGYPNGDGVTLRLGCAMVARGDNVRAFLTPQLSDEVDVILGGASSPPPSASSSGPVLVPGGGVALELQAKGSSSRLSTSRPA